MFARCTEMKTCHSCCVTLCFYIYQALSDLSNVIPFNDSNSFAPFIIIMNDCHFIKATAVYH